MDKYLWIFLNTRYDRVSFQEVVIGLTQHSRLYVNDREIANNCSSFFIHDDHLLLTTTSHVLRCLSILPEEQGESLVMEACFEKRVQQKEDIIRNTQPINVVLRLVATTAYIAY